MTDDIINPPVRGDRIRFRGPFDEPRGNHHHLGTDFGAQTPGVPGAEVVAATPGNFVHRYKSPSYGNVAVVERDNGDGTYSYFAYAHMADPKKLASGKSKMLPEVGDDVETGQTIGQMSNTGSSADGSSIPVHTHFEQITTGGRLDFSNGWPLGKGNVGVTESGIPWERVGPSFQLPNGWVAKSDNGRISVTVPPAQSAGAQQDVLPQPFQYPDATQRLQKLITDKYFRNYDGTSGTGAGPVSSGSPHSPPNGGPSPVPYFDLTNAARRLFGKMPSSDFPDFPSRTIPNGTINPINPQGDGQSTAPDGSALTYAQASPSTSASQPDAVSSSASGLFGNFPRAFGLAAAAFPATPDNSGSGSFPPDFNTLLAQGAARLSNAGRFIGNSLIGSAEAAPLSGSPLQGSSAQNWPGETPMAASSKGIYSPDMNESSLVDANQGFPRLVRRTYSQSQAWPSNAGAPAAPKGEGEFSLNNAYLEYQKRLNAGQSQASALGAGPLAPLLVPSDEADLSGGLPARIAALMGIDPRNPNQFAPTQDDDLRGFYRDNAAQPWTLQRWR